MVYGMLVIGGQLLSDTLPQSDISCEMREVGNQKRKPAMCMASMLADLCNPVGAS